MFALLRSAVRGTALSHEEKKAFSPDMIPSLLTLSAKQDLGHLLAFALKQNGLLPKEHAANAEKRIFMAVYRCENLSRVLVELSEALEAAKIPFVPLKGSILRAYYPESWMRTSCDIDVLVRKEDLERAIEYLVSGLGYVEKDRATHDVSLYTPGGIHVELHFDLVEEGRAAHAIDVLGSVWDDVTLKAGTSFSYEMSDAFFYFYHIAHMAKHFETGGCGVRPFLDLYILDRLETANPKAREALLQKAGLSVFAAASRDLSEVWFGEREPDSLLLEMEEFLFRGGIYGSVDNRVSLAQTKKGGRFGYLVSRIFIPYDKLKRYYPVLEKHRFLMPLMQVRRWLMLLRPDVARMAKNELKSNRKLEKSRADQMGNFLKNVGL
jgi:hypothetical protein